MSPSVSGGTAPPVDGGCGFWTPAKLAMGAGIEDVVAIKSLETGLVPPVPNYKEPDPGLGRLNLSVGGNYPVRYALRLGAGFGSQIAMTMPPLAVPSSLVSTTPLTSTAGGSATAPQAASQTIGRMDALRCSIDI